MAHTSLSAKIAHLKGKHQMGQIRASKIGYGLGINLYLVLLEAEICMLCKECCVDILNKNLDSSLEFLRLPGLLSSL